MEVVARSVAALHSARANGPVKGGSLSKRNVNEIPDRCSRVSNLRNRAQSGLVVTESPVLSAAGCKNARKEMQGVESNDGRLKQARLQSGKSLTRVSASLSSSASGSGLAQLSVALSLTARDPPPKGALERRRRCRQSLGAGADEWRWPCGFRGERHRWLKLRFATGDEIAVD